MLTIDPLTKRCLTGLIMAGGFLSIIYSGIMPAIVMISCIQLIAFHELLNLRDINFKPYNHYLEYGLYIGMHYTMLGFYLPSFFPVNHYIIGASIMLGMLFYFTYTLPNIDIKHQYLKLAWTVTLLVGIAISNFHIINSLNGLGWFLLPILYVCMNDIGAYLIGKAIGKTPWSKLSPRKTWEGLIGGMILSVTVSIIIGNFISSDNCITRHLFLPYYGRYNMARLITPAVYSLSGQSHIQIVPLQLHNLIISLMASFISPFTGLFVSGLKRAYEVKDFGDIIPGHGGVVDRVDCMTVMGILVYIYYIAFV